MTQFLLPSNQNILAHSIANPEPAFDADYEKERIVISDTPAKPNQLIKNNQKVLELVLTWKTLKEKKLEREAHINLGEFPSFWATLDVSYSVFQKYFTHDYQIAFIEAALEKFLIRRNDRYYAHGYSSTTLQVRADSAAHKQSGSLAKNKLRPILNSAEFTHANAAPLENQFIFADAREDKTKFLALAEREHMRSHLGNGVVKYPDLAFVKKGHVFVVEHKHKQEGGGGQNSAIQELVDFIQRSDQDHIHYVSFMDGWLFNELMILPDDKISDKIMGQRNAIRQALQRKPTNYFVNTAGFLKLLSDLI